MHEYELTLIFTPDLTQSKIDAMLEKLLSKEKSASLGKIKKKEVWGKRILAYPLKKHKEGIYLMMRVELKPEEVREVERKLRLEEKVIRYLLVTI